MSHARPVSTWGRGVQQWSDTESFLIAEADDDLQHDDDVRPCMVAFRDDEPLFVAFLRAFAKGQYADPIIELMALAAPLGANRLALSMGARAWSFDDPVPPVVDGVGDLRQRVLCITLAEEAATQVEVRTVLVPFSRTAGGTAWDAALHPPGGEGWITQALRLAIQRRADMAASQKDMRRQAQRCVRLGHLLALSEQAAGRLGLDGVRLP